MPETSDQTPIVDQPTPGPIESVVVKALVPPVARQIMLGRVAIDWDELPDGVEVIGVKRDELEAKCYITQSRVVFSRGKHRIEIPKGYAFDGASVPHIFWGFRGFSPIGRHLWAALCHDWICDNPDELFPGIGDAIFMVLLSESGVSGWRSAIFYAAVRLNHITPHWLKWTLGKLWYVSVRATLLGLVLYGLWKALA